MKIHKLIEKHHHELSKPKLLFLCWLYDKHPEGVERGKINYPNLSQDYLEKNVLPELSKLGLIDTPGLRTNYSKVVPNG